MVWFDISMFQHYYKTGKYQKGFIELQNVINSSEVEEQLKKENLIQISYDKNSPYTLLNVDFLTKLFLNLHPNNSEMLLFYGNLLIICNTKMIALVYFLRKFYYPLNKIFLLTSGPN